MAAMPWKFESSYPHQCFGVVAQLIERYVRIVEVVGLSPISSTKIKTKDGFIPSFVLSPDSLPGIMKTAMRNAVVGDSDI